MFSCVCNDLNIFNDELIHIQSSHPAAAQVRESITVPIILPRDAAVDLTFQIFVGLKTRY